MRLVRKKGTHVDNPGGKLSASIKNPLIPAPVSRTDEEIRELPDGTVVEWPHAVERMTEMRGGSGIKFRIDEVDTPCGCGSPCATGECRNKKEGIVRTTKTCSQASTTCGCWLKEARGLQLQVKGGEICLHTARRIFTGHVVCPYYGHLRISNPLERYTVILKTKDEKNRVIYLSAGSVGSMRRFINHSCAANTRIEELNGIRGPEIAIIAERAIEPGEEVTTNYGPHRNVYCTCGTENCCNKGRRDPLAVEEVSARLRNRK